MIKGIFSGLGSGIVALMRKELLPAIRFVLLALLLGSAAYGLSIFLYVRAQKTLGAAKTSAYYAIAPFAGALLSFAILGQAAGAFYALTLVIMLAGSALSVVDTLMFDSTGVCPCFSHTHHGASQFLLPGSGRNYGRHAARTAWPCLPSPDFGNQLDFHQRALGQGPHRHG